ncbi:MAG: type II toxin-antitoxin system prevent-host-death family antitoxin [Betaproteobacteria bacterium]|nr:type II toxin-antitoxin system prevent-host-death family antitoxin [Betaproteobacteria bacterium]
MNWSVAEAKQRLSEVVREAAHGPQIITNRERPVAALVSMEDLRLIEEARRARSPSLAQRFAELRQILAEEGTELPVAPRDEQGRPNPFADLLDTP